MEILYKPWPWYVAGPIIGATVPLLLWLGNKRLGISSTLRHVCAACVPGSIPLFKYNWRQEIWSLVFAGGLVLGGFIGGVLLKNPDPVAIASSTAQYLSSISVEQQPGLLPESLFSWADLASLKGVISMIVGGFLVGFGTRYAQGCTSGHGIFGLSTLQWPSFIATSCFFAGGILFARFVVPFVLAL